MLPTVEPSYVDDLVDHATWRPDWTPDRPRLLWYLTFTGHPHVWSCAAPAEDLLEQSGADVVPPDWLHLTVTHVGFADEVDERAARAVQQEVSQQLRDEPPLELTLGPLGVMRGAVVLPAQPAEPLRRLRTSVRRATARVGIDPPDDIEPGDEDYWPHVSLCYLNNRTDHEAIREALRTAESRTVQVSCDQLSEVLVTRRDGQYRWEVVAEAPLGDAPAHRTVSTASSWRAQS